MRPRVRTRPRRPTNLDESPISWRASFEPRNDDRFDRRRRDERAAIGSTSCETDATFGHWVCASCNRRTSTHARKQRRCRRRPRRPTRDSYSPHDVTKRLIFQDSARGARARRGARTRSKRAPSKDDARRKKFPRREDLCSIREVERTMRDFESRARGIASSRVVIDDARRAASTERWSALRGKRSSTRSATRRNVLEPSPGTSTSFPERRAASASRSAIPARARRVRVRPCRHRRSARCSMVRAGSTPEAVIAAHFCDSSSFSSVRAKYDPHGSRSGCGIDAESAGDRRGTRVAG